MLFCRSLGHGGAGTSPGSTLHAYPITRQARCQAPAALLLARRDTIERSGRTRTPSLSFEGCKRAPGVVAQRPPPPKRARADKAGTDDDPRGRRPATRQQEQGSPPPNGRRAPRNARDAPRHALPSPPQRTHTQRGRTAHALLRRRTAPPELPPRESRNDKKAGTNDHHPARHLGGVGIKSRQRPHPSRGTLVPASRRPHPPNDDAAASSRAERRASPGARIPAAADGSSDDVGSSST